MRKNEERMREGMKGQLKAAMEDMKRGELEAVVSAAEPIQRLPRTGEGLFDISGVDGDFFQAARWIYPVYAAYETECNKKEGYPDLLNQMRLINQRYGEGKPSLSKAAGFLDLFIGTIENVSPQLYEYYRELADVFKVRLNEVIGTYYREGHFVADGEDGQEAEALIRSSVRRACEKYILLEEKYREYSE